MVAGDEVVVADLFQHRLDVHAHLRRRGQRVRKRQPDGGRSADGNSPSSAGASTRTPSFGTDASSARV